MPRKSFRWLLLAALTFSVLFLQGCAKESAKQGLDKAEAAVNTVLDSWARGESPDKFADPSFIRAIDPDWKAGYRLMGFLSVAAKPSAEKPDHIHCRVALSLSDPKGKKVDKEVVYDVALGDTIVIGRGQLE